MDFLTHGPLGSFVAAELPYTRLQQTEELQLNRGDSSLQLEDL